MTRTGFSLLVPTTRSIVSQGIKAVSYVIVVAWLWLLIGPSFPTPAQAETADSPEGTLRALVRANADRDLIAMARLMAHDADIVGYTIGGRKYVGWNTFARDIGQAFAAMTRLELPIHDLRVWSHGEVAWFAMELDYVAYVSTERGLSRTVLPLRETGVLERRDGQWLLVAWHESLRAEDSGRASSPLRSIPSLPVSGQPAASTPDLSGEWDIQEEDKTYRATLDKNGNGSYSWQGGRITTISFTDRKWLGTWQQTGNDREGGFEILLSEDGTEAKGVWWYTRVGDRKNIPARQWGGSYVWKRVSNPSGVSTQ